MGSNSDILKILKDSDEYRFRKFDFQFSVVASVVFLLIIGIPGLFLWVYQPAATITLLILPIIMTSPAWGFCAWKMYLITKNPNQYEIYNAVLKNPYPAWHSIRFEVYIEGIGVVESSNIFSNSQFNERGFDQWNNKRVKVAYDNIDDRVVIIKAK